MATTRKRTLLFALALGAFALAARGEEWPHWRGPFRNDVVTEDSGWTGGRWPPREAAWTAEVGEGCTAPLVVGGRLYALGWWDGRDRLVCLDAATGQEEWRVDYAAPRYGRRSTGDEGVYSGPCGTPEYDPQTRYLYALNIDGDLHCWDTASEGRQVWAVNLYDRFDVPQRPKVGRSGLRDYGYTTAPLVHGDWLLVEVGSPTAGNLAAFDKRTGELAWMSENRDPAGHTGGLAPMTVDGLPCVAVLTFHHLLVARLDAENAGRSVAEYEWTTEFGNNIATPAVSGQTVLITSGYNHHAICRLDITLAGATKTWEQPFASKVCTPIVHGGHIYWAWQKLHCLDFATGEQRWEGGAFGDPGSCILTADDRLIVWGRNGDLALVETAARSPTNYRELARLEGIFSTDVWPHVVLADGQLFCKDRLGNIACFVIRGGAE